MRPAPAGYLPGDPGTTWDIAATEARRRLRRLYGCVVYQRPEVQAWER